jgi:hypothetical protein
MIGTCPAALPSSDQNSQRNRCFGSTCFKTASALKQAAEKVLWGAFVVRQAHHERRFRSDFVVHRSPEPVYRDFDPIRMNGAVAGDKRAFQQPANAQTDEEKQPRPAHRPQRFARNQAVNPVNYFL